MQEPNRKLLTITER